MSKETIQGKLEIIKTSMDYLKKEGFDSENASFTQEQAVKHTLQEAIEACLDIANHIISSEGFTRPETFSDYFTELEENDIIDKNLEKKLSEMAKFRNILVHRYDKFDREILEKVVEEDLDDIKEFSKKVYEYLERDES